MSFIEMSHRERRAAIILCILIILVQCIARMIHHVHPAIKNHRHEAIEAYLAYKALQDTIEPPSYQTLTEPFRFDPNSLPGDSLLLLGFSSRFVRNLVKYRNAGGSFRRPTDLMRIYGSDSLQIDSMLAWVEIPTRPTSNNLKQPMSVTESRMKLTRQAADKNAQVERIDLNVADSVSLVRLKGIGPVLSARIIRYRNILGGFSEVSQLKEVYGLSEETFVRIQPRLYVGKPHNMLHIDSMSFRQILRHPYTDYEVTKILKNQASSPRDSFIHELRAAMGEERWLRLWPYLFEKDPFQIMHTDSTKT